MFDETMAALKGGAFDDNSEKFIRDMLNRYRVQTKPGNNIPEGSTARDTLGDRLLDVWKNRDDKAGETVQAIIDTFRMQNKTKPGAAKKRAPKREPKIPVAKPTAAPMPVTPKPKPVHRPPRSEPAVRGGVRKRGRTRSECPKCKSMGVVLASSYSGDDYFSCVYCGWQAYKPADEGDPNASLAARLLGKSRKD